jgi:hypothetical protein
MMMWLVNGEELHLYISNDYKPPHTDSSTKKQEMERELKNYKIETRIKNKPPAVLDAQKKWPK